MCLIGIQPKSMDTSTELSEVVNSQMDNLIDKVLQKLKDWDVEAIPRADQSTSLK